MANESNIRSYRPGDELGIVKLLQLVFNGWPRLDLSCTPLDHWRWKCLDDPYKSNFIALGVINDRIIGAMHSLSYKIKIANDYYISHYAGDTAVHPDFRRLGLTKKMIDFSIEFRRKNGIKFTYFITTNPIIVKLNLKSKFASLFPHSIANLVWIDDIDLQMKAMPVDNAWFMKIGFHAAKFINKLGNAVSRTRPVSNDLDVSEVHWFDDRINEFWEKISKHYNFIVERNLGFLNWRYCDHRAGGFVVKQVEEDGQLLGYVVLKINRYRRDYPVGFIVDLLTLPERLDVADALVADAVHHFKSHDINIINYQVVRGHPYERVLKKHGFLDSRIKSYLFISSFELEEELVKLKESPKSKVYFSYGDIDSLPVSMPS